jgi:hypothetical protein
MAERQDKCPSTSGKKPLSKHAKVASCQCKLRFTLSLSRPSLAGNFTRVRVTPGIVSRADAVGQRAARCAFRLSSRAYRRKETRPAQLGRCQHGAHCMHGHSLLSSRSIPPNSSSSILYAWVQHTVQHQTKSTQGDPCKSGERSKSRCRSKRSRLSGGSRVGYGSPKMLRQPAAFGTKASDRCDGSRCGPIRCCAAAVALQSRVACFLGFPRKAPMIHRLLSRLSST